MDPDDACKAYTSYLSGNFIAGYVGFDVLQIEFMLLHDLNNSVAYGGDGTSPGPNTIILDEVDRFGLAQIHQLRGRVGRSDRQAYAFLLYSDSKTLGQKAQKRLQAVKEYVALGSGYDLALKDLEKFKKDLFNFRFQKVNGQLTNPAKINITKKNIARLKTIINRKPNA